MMVVLMKGIDGSDGDAVAVLMDYDKGGSVMMMTAIVTLMVVVMVTHMTTSERKTGREH